MPDPTCKGLRRPCQSIRAASSRRCGHRSARAPPQLRRLSTPTHGKGGACTNSLNAPTGRNETECGPVHCSRIGGTGGGAGPSRTDRVGSARGQDAGQIHGCKCVRFVREEGPSSGAAVECVACAENAPGLPTGFLLCWQESGTALSCHGWSHRLLHRASSAVLALPAAAACRNRGQRRQPVRHRSPRAFEESTRRTGVGLGGSLGVAAES
jgi:hypothetical protein